MTSPSAAVLDAFNATAAASVTVDAAYPSDTGIQMKLSASRSRVVALADEVAAHHNLTRAEFVALCQNRPTYTGGIDC